jgi:Tol biopolymer transport system component
MRRINLIISVIFLVACNETSVVDPPIFSKSYWNIHIMNINGSNINQLTNNTDHTWLVDISPLGSKIIFRTDDSYTMSLSGTDIQLISNSFYTQFSPDETKLLYFEGYVICIMNSDGTNKKYLAHATRMSHIPEPKFSPDGLAVVYTSSDSIFTVDIEGNENKYLTRGDYPQFTPDGSKIIFFYSQGLYKMDPDGNNIENIYAGSILEYIPFRISPNGTNIIFASSNQPGMVASALSIVNIDGTNKKNLVEFTNGFLFSTCIYFAFSPDGSKIIYCSLENGYYDIFVINIDGSDKQLLSSQIPESCVAPIFTKNGNKIIFQKWTEIQNE